MGVVTAAQPELVAIVPSSPWVAAVGALTVSSRTQMPIAIFMFDLLRVYQGVFHFAFGGTLGDLPSDTRSPASSGPSH
jgi:hypothetical protein